MNQLNDCMLTAVAPTGASDLNDGLRLHYLANGATGALGDSLQDLEYEFLVANGATSGQQINDMWKQILPPVVGFDGDLNDMLLPFWCAGGTFAPPAPPAFNPTPAGEDPWPAVWSASEETQFTFDARPYFADGGFISIWGLTGDVPAGMTISNGIVRYTPPLGDRDYGPIQVTGNNATGPVATSTNVNLETPANVAITFSPKSQYVEIGQSVTFVAQASAVTGYQWKKNGVDIPGANGFAYTVNNVQQSENGDEYECDCIGTGGVTKTTDKAILRTMQTFNNLADGSGSAVRQVTLAAGLYTLSMSGTGWTELRAITASIIGIG